MTRGRAISILVAATVILVIILLVAQCQRNQDTTATTNEFVPESTPFPTFSTFDGAPQPTPQQTELPAQIPAPKTSISTGNKIYTGKHIGEMVLANGQRLNIYEPAIDTMGNVKLADEGVVLWRRYFLGHLIQDTGWLQLKEGEQVVVNWESGISLTFRIGAYELRAGFDQPLVGLAQDKYGFVTCFVDSAHSTPSNRVFGGNVIYTLTIE